MSFGLMKASFSFPGSSESSEPPEKTKPNRIMQLVLGPTAFSEDTDRIAPIGRIALQFEWDLWYCGMSLYDKLWN
jgi:hypothetical protein